MVSLQSILVPSQPVQDSTFAVHVHAHGTDLARIKPGSLVVGSHLLLAPLQVVEDASLLCLGLR